MVIVGIYELTTVAYCGWNLPLALYESSEQTKALGWQL